MADWPYNTARWQRLRQAHLSIEPMCRGCAPRLVIASHVDHVHAISDGGPAFPGHDGLTSYCLSCHSAKTARGAEAGAARTSKPRRGCDSEGNPLDPRHPWNGGNGRISHATMERRMPSDLKPSRIPLTIVCGPPGSGKTTYVRERAGPHDVVICLDTIMQKITDAPEHDAPDWALKPALEARNGMLRRLANDCEHNAAWFIVSAPDPADRRKWKTRLGGELVVIETPLPECIARIKADETRPAHRIESMVEAATRWWAANPHRRQRTIGKSLRAESIGPGGGLKIQLVQKGDQ